MASFRELLQQAKSQIREVDTAEGEALLADGWTLLDVREPDESEQGAIPGTVYIPVVSSSRTSRIASLIGPPLSL